MSKVKRLAVVASGRGSNLANIHRAILAGELSSIELSLVVSNNSTSGAMQYAIANDIPARHISLLKSSDDADAFDREFLQALDQARIDIIALAGYMKRLPDTVVTMYHNRVLNVHPALLPLFGGAGMYGKFVHEAVLAAGCKVSGATVHFVTTEYDKGAILLQQCCPITEGETAEMLAARVREIEFELYPRAIDLVAQEKVIIENNRARILE